MVSLTEKTTIPLPAAEVWPLLNDPALVASCIPGAQLAPDQGDGLWRGSIRVKFGPTVAVFRGEAGLTFDDAARACTIEGRGIDGRGASRALASGVVKVSGSDVTELAVDGSFTVSGPLETFANAGGVHVARALLAEFSANLAKLVADQRTTAPPPAADALPSAPADAMLAPTSPAPAPPAASELSGMGLLWRAFLSWLRVLTIASGDSVVFQTLDAGWSAHGVRHLLARARWSRRRASPSPRRAAGKRGRRARR